MFQQDSDKLMKKLVIIYNMQVKTNEALVVLSNLLKKQNNVINKFRDNRDKIYDSEDDFENGIQIPRLPVKTIEELQQFEEWLNKDNENCRRYRRELKLLGGQNFHNQVNNAMSFTMTYDVGKQTTWTGLTAKSYKFSDKKVAATIRDVIVQQYKHTKADTEKRMKTWLQKAGDRVKSSQISSPLK